MVWGLGTVLGPVIGGMDPFHRHRAAGDGR